MDKFVSAPERQPGYVCEGSLRMFYPKLDDADFAQRLALFWRDKMGRTIADLGILEIDF